MKPTTKLRKKIEALIYAILTKVDSLREGIVSYAYWKDDLRCYCVCLSDYEVYTNDKRFRVLSNAWYKAGKALGVKIIFAYAEPIEEKLEKLLNEDNLYINV
nr:MAG TPA: hypothetical protein [Caudoviricetes sp.]